MTDDKRNHPRVPHHFDCRWLGKWGTTEARLNDLSATGCYVVGRLTTPSVAEIGTRTRVQRPAPSWC